MADSPNINTGNVITFSIFSNGEKVSDELRFKSIYIHHELNKIGKAVLKIIAGNMADADVPESSAETFKPGQIIKIELGYQNNNKKVFEGLVTSHQIKIPDNAESSSLLIVECKNQAIKSTVIRKNRIFQNKKDSEAIATVLSDSGLTVTVEDTKAVHTQLIQYYCTDWDFALSRADACGLYVATNGNDVTIKSPNVTQSPVLKITYGTDLLSFNGEIVAEDQFERVVAVGWDAQKQETVIVNSSVPSLNEQGNLTLKDISRVLGKGTIILQSDSCTDKEVLKSWADATLIKSGISRYRGSFSFRGNAGIEPGSIIELAGMGKRFNGNVFAGSVTHTVKEGLWITEVGMGVSPLNITQYTDVVTPPASGFIPGIEGLHIGKVSKLIDDPENAFRIEVNIPILNNDENKIWARLAQLDASSGYGSFFIPSVGDEVVLGFINNDPNQAIILGSLYSGKHQASYKLTEENYKKAIVTGSQLIVEFDDEKKAITIFTPGNNTIVVSDDAEGITLKDQNDNEIVMNAGGIELQSAKDITFKAKGNILLDSSGKLTVKARQDTSVEGLNVNVKAQTGVKVSGSATAELSASGQTTVKGAMVMIN